MITFNLAWWQIVVIIVVYPIASGFIDAAMQDFKEYRKRKSLEKSMKLFQDVINKDPIK